MEGLNVNTFLSILVPLSLYFTLTLTGAFLKDIFNTIVKKDARFRFSRVLVGAITGAFIMLGLEEILLYKMSLNLVVTISFIIGTISFELFDRLSKIDNVVEFIKLFKKTLDESKDDKGDG